MGKYGTQNQAKPPPIIMTNEEKAQLMAKQQAEQIVNQIEEGKMKVSPQKKQLKGPPKIEEEESLETIE